LSPIEIACTLGSVRISNVTVIGNAIQTKKNFNAINVTSGKLIMDNCRLRSTTWNTIKVLEGGSLDVSRSKFIQSNAFAVSGLNHVSIVVKDCEFFQSGVQVVGGPAAIEKSMFSGADGVDVQKSGETPTSITECKFVGCLEAGFTATDKANVTATNSQFDGCKFGARVADSECVINHCTFAKSKHGAVELTGGKLEVTSGSIIEDSANFGCQVKGGSFELIDSQISKTVGSGIITQEGNTNIRIRNSDLSNCGGYGIHMIEGSLSIEGGSINECEQGGVYLSEKFSRGSIVGTKFIDNLGGGIVADAGELDCQEILISGSQIGLLASGEAKLPVNITLRKAIFKNISEVAADIEGAVNLNVRQGNFGDLPDDKHYRTLGGAKVTVEL
jgi:Right handed beta helix region